MANQISLYIADDHPVYRDGLVRFFDQEGFLIVGSGSDGRKALKDLLRLQPEVAILDLVMPKLSGYEVVEALQREQISTRSILLTGSLEREKVYEAFEIGASGFILKTADWDEIARMIKQVAEGQTVIASEVMTMLAGEIREKAGTQIDLTEREMEVLRLMDRPIEQIADQLDIQASTTKVHLSNIYRKLGVSNRAQAIATAMRRGLLK